MRLQFSLTRSRHFNSEKRCFVSMLVTARQRALRLPTSATSFRPRVIAGVEQVALQHHEVLRVQRDHHRRVFRCPAHL